MSYYGGSGEGITGSFVFLILSKSSLLAFYHLFDEGEKKGKNLYLVSSSMILLLLLLSKKYILPLYQEKSSIVLLYLI